MYLRKALRGSIAAGAFTLLATLCAYTFRLVLANRLSVSDYGLFYSVYSFFMIFLVFSDLGFTQAVSKHIVDLSVKKETAKIKSIMVCAIYLQLALSFAIFLVCLLFSQQISSQFFRVPGTREFLLMGVWFLTLPVSTFFAVLFQGFQKPGLVGSIDFSKNLAALILFLLFLNAGFGALSPFLAYMLVNLILLLIYMPFLLREFPGFGSIKTIFDFSLVKKILLFSVYLTLAGAISIILVQTDTIMLTYFKGVEVVGLYQTAVPIALLIGYISAILFLVAFPMISELYTRGKMKELAEGLHLLYKYVFILSIPIAVVLFSFPEIAISILFGSKYVAAAMPLRILSASAMFSLLLNLNNQVISATGNPKEIAKTMLYAALANIALNALLIPKLGMSGAAIGTLLSFGLGAVLSTAKVKAHINIRLPVREILLAFAIGAISCATIFLLKNALSLSMWAEIAVIGAIISIMYVLLLFAFRLVDASELSELFRQAATKK